MRRSIVLGMLLTLGGLAAVYAQPPAADAQKVVDVEKVNDKLYVLRGNGGGGNVAVFLTANGVVVVDAKNPGWGTPILNKIKELTPKPVTTLINTHTHGDHVSGNVEFPATIDFVAQENTKVNMEKMPIFKEHNGVGLPKEGAKDLFMLFKRLHTRHDYPGTGIGLAMCKRIVERHGGRVWAESVAQRGATIHFTLGD